jgi:hypothetical protein
MRVRYQRRGRAERGPLLEEFCEVTGYERKYALKLLLGHRPGPARSAAARKGRGAVYGAAELAAILPVWRTAGEPCGKRLAALLPQWLPWSEKEHGALDPAVREKALRASPATLDRLLSSQRRERPAARPRAGSEVRRQIPLREHAATAVEPGWLQADTVFHCGTSTRGSFTCSLVLVDTASQWNVLRATWNHSDLAIHSRIAEEEKRLPFPLLGIHTDNGGEFINHTLVRYFKDRPVPVVQTRSRPYCKNDNCHAEQKNRVLIRQFAGYERLGHPELAAALDELLQDWSLYQNLFIPTLKLKHKERHGAKVKKSHEPAHTPCERLLASPAVSRAAKAHLREQLAATNPFTLRARITAKQTAFAALRQKLEGS